MVLEYDPGRAGTFEPLAGVRSGTIVVLVSGNNSVSARGQRAKLELVARIAQRVGGLSTPASWPLRRSRWIVRLDGRDGPARDLRRRGGPAR
jgi:hypothetical protein